MKRLYMLMTAALALSCGACVAAGTVQAKEKSIASQGGIVYRQDGMEVALYAEDMLLLENKLSTIPEVPFDPGCYVSAAQQEAVHEPASEIVDGSNHRIRLDVDETGLGRGYEPVEEEQTETEIDEETETPAQAETGDDSIPADPSNGDSPGTEDTEDISSGSSEEESPEDGDAEDISDPTDLPEEESPEDGEGEDISAPADPSEENPPESEAAEEDSNLDDGAAESLPEIKDTME